MRDMKITPDQQIAAMYAIECLPEPKSQDEACATADAWKLHEAIQQHRYPSQELTAESEADNPPAPSADQPPKGNS